MMDRHGGCRGWYRVRDDCRRGFEMLSCLFFESERRRQQRTLCSKVPDPPCNYSKGAKASEGPISTNPSRI